MTDKYYVGMVEVPREEFEEKKKQELAAGHGVTGTQQVDGHPEYTLEDGIVIRGDDEGGFNRMEDGKPQEAWLAGTVNVWVQDEPTDQGKLEFFCKA